MAFEPDGVATTVSISSGLSIMIWRMPSAMATGLIGCSLLPAGRRKKKRAPPAAGRYEPVEFGFRFVQFRKAAGAGSGQADQQGDLPFVGIGLVPGEPVAEPLFLGGRRLRFEIALDQRFPAVFVCEVVYHKAFIFFSSSSICRRAVERLTLMLFFGRPVAAAISSSESA